MLTKTSVSFDYEYEAEEIGTCIYGSVTGSYEPADKSDRITPETAAEFTVESVHVYRVVTEHADLKREKMHGRMVDDFENLYSMHVANLDNEKLVELAEGEL